MRELLQQALDALEEATAYTSSPSWSPSMTQECKAVITALRSALAAPQPEPVGWFKHDKVSQCWHPQYDHMADRYAKEQGWQQLYAAPPAAPAPAVPAVCDGGTCGLGGYCANCPKQSAAPVVREPLTDEQIDALQEQCTAPEWRDDTADGWHMGMNFRKFARDVLAANGIGGGGK